MFHSKAKYFIVLCLYGNTEQFESEEEIFSIDYTA